MTQSEFNGTTMTIVATIKDDNGILFWGIQEKKIDN